MRHRVVGHQRVVDPVGGGHRRDAEGHVRDRASPTTTTRRPTSSTTSTSCARPGAFRFANQLAAWVEVEDGRIVDAGYSGSGLIGATTVRLANLRTDVRAGPAARHPPRARDRRTRSARFVQTTGGRTGLPAPRRVKHPPFVQFKAPTVWTTLSLTIHADGTSSFEVLGASTFPRHWVYDADGKLAAKVGLADFKDWYRDAFGKHTPWGDAGLEGARHRGRDRARAPAVHHDHARRTPSPRSARSRRASTLVEQGERATSSSSCSTACSRCRSTASRVAELGPGAVLGERAVLEGGMRTATLRSADRVPGRGRSTRPDRPRRAPQRGSQERHRRDDEVSVAPCGSPPGTSTR